MNPAPIKKGWIARVREIQSFHIEQLKENPDWTIQDTAFALQRSIGSVSQDLTLASFLKTHENQLSRFRHMKDALLYVRRLKNEMRLTV